LTKMPIFSGVGTRPIASATRKRLAFSVAAEELGGGNPDGSDEVFYLLTPTITATSSAVLSFFTGASNMPVAAATPVRSPIPSPTPTPSPVPGAPVGLAPGELSIVRSTVALAQSNASAGAGADTASETMRRPALPIELNGVSLSVNGAAAGLYFVSGTDKQINFVMPIGLLNGVQTVAVNVLDSGANTDTLHRGLVQIVTGQPDIFTSTMDAGGRARAFNITNNMMTPEPFDVTTGGTATIIQLHVTGLRFAAPGEITVTVILKKVSCGTDVNIEQAGVPAVIPAEMCYLGWQESLIQLAQLVEPEIPDGE